MRVLEEHPLHLPDVGFRQAPAVGAEPAQIDQRVASQPARQIDVRIDVTERQGARRREDWFAPVQARVPLTCHRSPFPLLPIGEDDVVELVN